MTTSACSTRLSTWTTTRAIPPGTAAPNLISPELASTRPGPAATQPFLSRGGLNLRVSSYRARVGLAIPAARRSPRSGPVSSRGRLFAEIRAGLDVSHACGDAMSEFAGQVGHELALPVEGDDVVAVLEHDRLDDAAQVLLQVERIAEARAIVAARMEYHG